MQANQLLTADLLDILFEGKNKDYGAYKLRKTYNRRLITSVGLTCTIVALFFTTYYFANAKSTEETAPMKVSDVTLKEAAKEEEPEPVVIKPAPPKPPEPLKTIKSTNVLIVPDEEVAPEDKPPVQEDLKDARIAAFTQDGVVSDLVQPVDGVKDGIEKGIIDAPPKGRGDKENDGFEPVEIESKYPGGPVSWSRFLNRTLGNNYPSEAFEKNIQGTVVIQFVVDVDGSVSRVEAISGPPELRETAVSTIRKSGRWEPAIQNGRLVKSYKKQPIKFVLQGE